MFDSGRTMAFIPIGLDDYVAKYVERNLSARPDELRMRLLAALADFRSGVRCWCGAPIWVIGSAEVGNACFTCITGAAVPTGDYELREAARGRRGAPGSGD